MPINKAMWESNIRTKFPDAVSVDIAYDHDRGHWKAKVRMPDEAKDFEMVQNQLDDDIPPKPEGEQQP